MALDSNIVGAVTGTGADVNADRELKTTLTQDVAKAGFVVNAGEAHDGAAALLESCALLTFRTTTGLELALTTACFQTHPDLARLFLLRQSTEQAQRQ